MNNRILIHNHTSASRTEGFQNWNHIDERITSYKLLAFSSWASHKKMGWTSFFVNFPALVTKLMVNIRISMCRLCLMASKTWDNFSMFLLCGLGRIESHTWEVNLKGSTTPIMRWVQHYKLSLNGRPPDHAQNSGVVERVTRTTS